MSELPSSKLVEQRYFSESKQKMTRSVKYFEAILSNFILSMKAKSDFAGESHLFSLIASVLYPTVDQELININTIEWSSSLHHVFIETK